MIPELPEDLVHLERGGERLDEDRGPDRAGREVEGDLCGPEHVVPQPGFEVVLELRKIQIGSGPPPPEFLGVAKKEETRVEEARGNRMVFYLEMPFLEMPAPGADHECGDLRVESVLLAFRGSEPDLPTDRIVNIRLSEYGAHPRRGMGIFEVGHENTSPRIEGVDDHLPVHRASDLNPAICEVGRSGRYGPCLGSDPLCLAREFRSAARREDSLELAPLREELPASLFELAVQRHQKVDRRRAEHLLAPARQAPGNSDGSFRLGRSSRRRTCAPVRWNLQTLGLGGRRRTVDVLDAPSGPRTIAATNRLAKRFGIAFAIPRDRKPQRSWTGPPSTPGGSGRP